LALQIFNGFAVQPCSWNFGLMLCL